MPKEKGDNIYVCVFIEEKEETIASVFIFKTITAKLK